MVYTLQFITLNMFRKILGNNTCTNIIFQLDYHLWKIYQEGSKAQVAYASSDEQKVMLPDILIIFLIHLQSIQVTTESNSLKGCGTSHRSANHPNVTVAK